MRQFTQSMLCAAALSTASLQAADSMNGPQVVTSVLHTFGTQVEGPGVPGSANQDLSVTRGTVELLSGMPVHDDAILLFGAGYKLFRLDWGSNPHHANDLFHNATAQVGVLLTHFDGWRWIGSAGLSSNLANGSFTNATEWSGMLWGKYAWKEDISLHIGVLGKVGIEDYTVLPILGLDWEPEGPWSAALIVPVKMELRYTYDSNWSVATRLRYLSERNRFKSSDPTPSGVFEYTLVGGEVELVYQTETPSVQLSLAAGYSGYQKLKVWDSRGNNRLSYDLDNGAFIAFKVEVEFPVEKY